MEQPHDRQATLFCRVSSRHQADNFSRDVQERLGREYAARQGLTVTKVFRVVETASKPDERREWGKFLAYVRANPERHVLVASVDRALRNFKDLPEMQELQRIHGKTVHFFNEGLVLSDEHRSSTDLRLGIHASVASWYATELAEKTKRGLNEKAMAGEWPKKAPYGYLHDTVNKTIVVDPEKARWVKRIKELSAEARRLTCEEVREERRDQAVSAREDTQKAAGKELGADYMLKGNFSTIVDEADGVKGVYYQVDLEMVDLENNVKAWFGQKKIKKVIERKRVLF